MGYRRGAADAIAGKLSAPTTAAKNGDEDHARPSGRVFSPDQRDHAQHARGKAFEQLANTPGRASFTAILRLTENPECPIPKSRLLEIARTRAAEDAEATAWAPGDALTAEANAEAPPRTAKDLQSTALRRLDDMRYDLLHGDFSQGATLKAQPDETAVQNWIADRLRLKGRAGVFGRAGTARCLQKRA